MMFLVAHDELSVGEPLIRPESLTRAVMGALLADLAMRRRIRVLDGYVQCAEKVPPIEPADDAGNFFMDCLVAQNRHFTVGQWLRQLALDVNFQVAQRLVEAGVVGHRQSPRGLVRHGADRYPAASLAAAAAPRLTLARCFQRPTEFDLRLGVLAGLSAAVGLQRFVGRDLSQAVLSEICDELMHHMPTDLREIIDSVGQGR